MADTHTKRLGFNEDGDPIVGVSKKDPLPVQLGKGEEKLIAATLEEILIEARRIRRGIEIIIRQELNGDTD